MGSNGGRGAGSFAAELGRWLCESYLWSHYGTFTFSPYTESPKPGLGPSKLPHTDVGPSEASTRRSWDRFVRRVSRAAHNEIGWFVAFEPGALLGRRHIHALLCDAATVTPEQVDRLWKAGRSEVEVYNPSRGAAHYVAKFAGLDIADWDVGGSLVRRAARQPRVT